MSHTNGKSVINFDSVRAYKANDKKRDKEIDFIPQTSNKKQSHTVNESTTRRPTHPTERRNIRNSYNNSNRRYQSSLNKNRHKVARLVAAGMLSASMLVGGIVGYNINSHNTGSIEYSLDEYDSSELFYATNELVKEVASDKALSENPNLEDNLSDYYLESYNEYSVTPFYGEVTLQLNYINKDPRDRGILEPIPVKVTLPKDFAKNVYLPFKDLRETSQHASDKEKEKTSYWLKINKHITALTDGLEEYSKSTKDKQYVDLAQAVLDNARTTADNSDDGR